MLESADDFSGKFETADAHLIFPVIKQLVYEAHVCLNASFTESAGPSRKKDNHPMMRLGTGNCL